LIAGPVTQAPTPSATTSWEQWRHLPGVVDIGGPRTDGKLVVSAQGRLSLLSTSGTLKPFARASDGYSSTTGEPYFAVSPGGSTPSGCRFSPDDVYAIEQGSPPSIIRVDTTGRAGVFTNLPSMATPSGIAFDTVGGFGHRLLVTATSQGRGVVLAVDCDGVVATITETGPAVEGGIAVAPTSFGRYAGYLIAVSEGTGNVIGIGPGGDSTVVVASGVQAGGDIGVESAGFIPHGFLTSGELYVADRGSQPQPHPGTDTVLRLSSAALRAAAVHEGDLLAATEGGGITVAVACAATCTARTVATASPVAHVEGHIVAVAGASEGRAWMWLIAGAGALAIVLAGGFLWRRLAARMAQTPLGHAAVRIRMVQIPGRSYPPRVI
jgi:hypothetical protein